MNYVITMRTSAYGLLITWYRFFPSLAHFQVFFAIFLGFGVLKGTSYSAYSLPSFNEGRSNFSYTIGERGLLQCSVKNLGTKQVIWLKDNTDHPLTVGTMVYVNEDEFSVEHQPGREEWNLVIKKVQKKHEGLYECQISTKEDIKRFVRLNVLDAMPAQNEGIIITGQDFVDKGDKIVLTCNATGVKQPPDDIDWFVDGQKIKESQKRGIVILKFRVSKTKTLHSKLEISHSDMSDSGNYICRSSDLSITSKAVIVLNGTINKRTKKLLDYNGSDAHEYPGKVDQAKSVDNAANIAEPSWNNLFFIVLMCALTFIKLNISL